MLAARKIASIIRYTITLPVTGTSVSRFGSGVFAASASAGPYSVFKGLMPRRRESGNAPGVAPASCLRFRTVREI